MGEQSGIAAVEQMIATIKDFAGELKEVLGPAMTAVPIVGDAIAIAVGLKDMVQNIINLVSAIVDAVYKAKV